eukprot:30837-Pelagococcus_subviridis.AAC.4
MCQSRMRVIGGFYSHVSKREAHGARMGSGRSARRAHRRRRRRDPLPSCASSPSPSARTRRSCS